MVQIRCWSNKQYDDQNKVEHIAISNMVVKRHSDFLVLGFFAGVDVMGYMELSLANPSVV